MQLLSSSKKKGNITILEEKMKLIITTLLVLFSGSLWADPVTDGFVTTKRIAWFSNIYQGKQLTCPETCKIHHGLIAEHELYKYGTGVRPQKTYVCKVMTKKIPVENDSLTHFRPPITTWVYGNQYNNVPLCEYVKDHQQIKKAKRFYCLCSTK